MGRAIDTRSIKGRMIKDSFIPKGNFLARALTSGAKTDTKL